VTRDIFRYVPQIERVGIEKQIGRREVALLLERDRQLEDYLNGLDTGEGGAAELRFSAFVLLTTMSGPDRAAGGGELGSFVCLLGVAGTTSTLVEVYRNGSVVGSVSIPSGAVTATGTASGALSPTDIVTVRTPVIGTGAKRLTVIVPV
jgi:hypothetical protein